MPSLGRRAAPSLRLVGVALLLVAMVAGCSASSREEVEADWCGAPRGQVPDDPSTAFTTVGG